MRIKNAQHFFLPGVADPDLQSSAPPPHVGSDFSQPCGRSEPVASLNSGGTALRASACAEYGTAHLQALALQRIRDTAAVPQQHDIRARVERRPEAPVAANRAVHPRTRLKTAR
jgi:hypothetical protein